MRKISDGRIIIDTEIDTSGATSGTKKLKDTLKQAQTEFGNTTKETRKFQQEMNKLKDILGGEVPEATQKAYSDMAKLRVEVKNASREFGRNSTEAMKAKNALNSYALGLDDTTFKQVYMRSQLGLTESQLTSQANSIKLNARMVKLMGSQTEILTKQMQGLASKGIKPSDLLPASTLGQFQMLNETIKASGNPIYRLSGLYRNFGTSMEKSIKGWTAQKMAIKMAEGDMVKYGLLLRGITAAQMNLGLAFPIVGLAAAAFYVGIFKGALEADSKLKALAETVKGKLGQAFKPLIDVAGSVLKVILTLTGKIADMMIAFDQSHPIISKVVAAIGFLLPAMTLLLLPLSMGIGLFAGWKVAINGAWVVIGGIASAIGVASATFLTFATIIGTLTAGFIYLWKTNEGFRNAITGIWESIAATGQKAFGGLVTLFTKTLPDAFKEGGFKGLATTIGGMLTNLVATVTTKGPELLKSGGDIIKNLATGITTNAPTLLAKGTDIIKSIVTPIQANLPTILATGSQIITNLITGIATALPIIVAKMNETRLFILNSIRVMLPAILELGVNIITMLIQGIAQALPIIIGIGLQIITAIINTIVENLPTVVNTGLAVLTTFIQGIVDALPVLIDAGIQIILALVNAITENLPSLIESSLSIITTLVNGIVQLLPTIIEAGIKVLIALIDGLVQTLPKLIDMIPQIITTIVNVISQNLPQIIEAGIKILIAIINGLVQALPQLIAMVPQITNAIITTLINNLPLILEAGVKILVAIISGLIQAIPQLISAIPQITNAIIGAFGNVNWGSIGTNIMKGIGDGISSGMNSIMSKVSSSVQKIKDKFTEAKSFDIHSPSRWGKNFVGRNIVKGIGGGITAETPNLLNDADSMVRELKTSMDFNTARTTSNIVGSANKAANVSNSTTTITESDTGPKVYIEHFHGTDESNITQLAQEIAFLDKRKPN